MAVPKRKHSKSKTRIKRNSHYKREEVKVIKTKDKKALKRPHVDEYVEI